MKAKNSPLRQTKPEDMGWGSIKPSTHATLKRIARRQLRAAEKQLFMREEIRRQVAEAREQKERLHRNIAAAERSLRSMLDSIDAQLQPAHEAGNVTDVIGRVHIVREVRILSGHSERKLTVLASCAL